MQLADAFGPAFIEAANTSSGAIKMISDAFDRIGEKSAPALEKIGPALKRLIDIAGPIFDQLIEIGAETIETFLNVAASFLEVALPAIEVFAKQFTFVLEKVFSVIKVVGDVLEGIVDTVTSVIKWFQKLLGVIGDENTSTPSNGLDTRSSPAKVFSELFNPSPMLLDDFPHFASGGVFAPNNPMLGVLGDNPREVEIAAPRSAMQDAFLDALDQRSVGTASKTNVNIRFSGSLAQLGRLLQPVVTVETARQGPSFAR